MSLFGETQELISPIETYPIHWSRWKLTWISWRSSALRLLMSSRSCCSSGVRSERQGQPSSEHRANPARRPTLGRQSVGNINADCYTMHSDFIWGVLVRRSPIYQNYTELGIAFFNSALVQKHSLAPHEDESAHKARLFPPLTAQNKQINRAHCQTYRGVDVESRRESP